MERTVSLAQIAERTLTHSLVTTNKAGWSHARSMLDVRIGEIAQIREACRTASILMPFMRGAIERVVLRDAFPFATQPELLTHGYNKTVWKIPETADHTALACRVHFYTIGMSSDQLLAHAATSKARLQQVQQAFSDDENPVVPSHFLIANTPTLGKGAVVEVAPFVQGEDVFAISDPHKLSKKQKACLGKIADVAERKIGNRYLDLLGSNNILVTDTDETCIVDWETAPLPNHTYHFQHQQRVHQLRAMAA